MLNACRLCFLPFPSLPSQLERLRECEEALAKLPVIAAGLHSTEPVRCLQHVRNLRHLLSVLDAFPTSVQRCVHAGMSLGWLRGDDDAPPRRFPVADKLLAIFDAVLNSGVMYRVCNFLSDEFMSAPDDAALKMKLQLQEAACDCLHYFMHGPQYAHMPEESPWHPDRKLGKGCVGDVAPLVDACAPRVHRCATPSHGVGDPDLRPPAACWSAPSSRMGAAPSWTWPP